jgi:hypothetical protein
MIVLASSRQIRALSGSRCHLVLGHRLPRWRGEVNYGNHDGDRCPASGVPLDREFGSNPPGALAHAGKPQVAIT